jgi:hypothetical protein
VFDTGDISLALDTSKSLARQNNTPESLGFENLINTTRGINGLVFDIANLPGTVTANDFIFQMSPQGAFNEAANPPASWQAAPAPSMVTVQAGSPSRVIITWANNAVERRWLRVTIKANANTGLAVPEVYYLGHLQGETTGASGGRFTVLVADILAVRAALSQGTSINSVVDLDKSGVVLVADILAARSQLTRELTQITVPATSGGGGGDWEEGSGEETVELGDDNGLMFSSFSTTEQTTVPALSIRTLESDQETAVGLVHFADEPSAVRNPDEPLSRLAESIGESGAIPSGSNESDSSDASSVVSPTVSSMNELTAAGTSSGVVLVGAEVLQDLSTSLQLPVPSSRRTGSRSAPPVMPHSIAPSQPQQVVETAGNSGSIRVDLSAGTIRPHAEGIDHDPQSIRDALFGRLTTPAGSPSRAARPTTKAEKLRSVDQFFDSLSDDNQ